MSAFQVLAEPHRRHLLDLLREGERSVTELVGGLGLSQPGVSKHLRVLREAGLVRVRVDAQRRLYALRPQPLDELHEWLEPYRRLWSEHLGRPEEELAGDPVDVVDSIWIPTARRERERHHAGERREHRLRELTPSSRKLERLLGPMDAIVVDG